MKNSRQNIDMSIVIPAYNEEKNIQILYSSLKNVLNCLAKTYEIIFAEDGSIDNTFNILQSLYEKDRTLKIIKLRKNFGQTLALAAGIDLARGDIIITMDADLQNDPADIPRLLSKLDEGYDIVSGWRKDRKDKAITRKIPSKMANWIIGSMTGVRIHDYGCTLKAYRASFIKNMHLYSDMHRFLPALGAVTGAKITEIPVTHHPRMYGKSKYGISRTGKVLFDLLAIKLITQFSSQPLHLFGLIGAFSLLIGTFFGIRSFQLYIYNIKERFSIVIPAVFFLSYFLGFYLIGLGVLSELALKMSDFRISRMKPILTNNNGV